MMDFHDRAGLSSGGTVLMVLMMFVLLVGLIAVGWLVLRPAGHPARTVGFGGAPTVGAPPAAAPDTLMARRILDERLARGELDPEDYQRRRQLLEGPAGES